MGSPVSSLSPYQFAFNGFIFGSGTPYIVESVDGLAGTSPVRVQDDNRGYIDGSWSGRDFYDGRTVTFDILILGDSSYNAQYYYNQLQNNLYIQQTGYYPSTATSSSYQLGVFQFELTSTTGLKRMWGRVRAINTTVDPEFTFGFISTQVEFYFPDPRYYDDTATVVSGSSVSLNNTGWATSCPVIYIASPSATFNITNIGGYTMNFANVNTAATMQIDTLARTIYQGTTTYARQTMIYSSQWLSLPPLGSDTWTLSSGSMQVTYRNAYV
jgi:hypothetical protein